MRRTTVFFLCGVLFALASSDAQASTIRDDRSDSLYTALAASTVYSGVGKVYETTSVSTYAGSGTLISSQWVLTAAHMVTGATSAGNLTFIINGTTYTADSYTYYSGYSKDTLSGDLALVHLSTAVTGVTYATLCTGTTESLLGKTATYVGYGCTGTGVSGYSSSTYGTKRAVQNVLDCIGTSYGDLPATDFISDFDNPAGGATTNRTGSPAALDLEGLIAPGDSGGGVFVTIGGTTYLAGVTSFLCWVDGTSDASYGDLSGAVSVYSYLNWITSTTATVVPEPSTLCLLAVGIVFGGRRRRKSQVNIKQER